MLIVRELVVWHIANKAKANQHKFACNGAALLPKHAHMRKRGFRKKKKMKKQTQFTFDSLPGKKFRNMKHDGVTTLKRIDATQTQQTNEQKRRKKKLVSHVHTLGIVPFLDKNNVFVF